MLVVMKFGGTSVSNEENRDLAIKKVKDQLALGNQVIVVVSAIGREPEPYSTKVLAKFCEGLNGAQKDRCLSMGEILSSLAFENQCRKHNIETHACTPSELGIITDDSYGHAEVDCVCTMWLEHYLEKMKVVVVPGFIGLSNTGRVTTLGTGGSDKTALLLADAMKADEVIIYTDVCGIYDHDPKNDASATQYESISFDECLKLINSGAKVMMKDSVELAKQKNIPFTVACTFSDEKGTKVF